MVGAKILIVPGLNSHEARLSLLMQVKAALEKARKDKPYSSDHRWKIGKDGKKGIKWN